VEGITTLRERKGQAMRSMIKISTVVAGVLAVTFGGGLAAPVYGQAGANILKACRGPTGTGKAFVGDPITCSVEVQNPSPEINDVCMTSIVDVTLGDGAAACGGGMCSCVGGDKDGQDCLGQGDCPPLSGSRRGVCGRKGRVTGNLLVGDPALQALFKCVGGGNNGSSCNPSAGPSACPGGTCCIRLDALHPDVTVNHHDTVQLNDNDPLPDEAIANGKDLGTSLPFRLRFQAFLDIEDLDCGDRNTDPCSVTIEGDARVFCEKQGVGGCTVVSTARPALQEAVDAAPDGATITVNGRCAGPVRITKRANLTVQGVLPEGSTACKGGGAPLRQDLRSTVFGGCDSSDVSRCELVKVTESPNVTVRYLNIVDSFNSGVEYKRTSGGTAFCNCIARNAEEGIEFDKGSGGHLALQNLVKDNAKALEEDADGGIGVHDSQGNTVRANVVESNLRGGIFIEDDADETVVLNNVVRMNIGNGIQVADSDRNLVEGNVVAGNTQDGVFLNNADKNRVVADVVSSNGRNGVRLRRAGKNSIDANDVSGNGSGSTAEQVMCESGSDDSTGMNKVNGVPNVPLPAACM